MELKLAELKPVALVLGAPSEGGASQGWQNLDAPDTVAFDLAGLSLATL